MQGQATKILQDVRIIQKCFIVREDGKLLALRRAADDRSRGGMWDLPGGGYEQGEEILDAMKREVLEEAGITVRSLAPIFVMNHQGETKGFFAGFNVFGLCYVSRDWSGEVVLSPEHTEYAWVTPAQFAQFAYGEDNGFFRASLDALLALPVPKVSAVTP